MRLLYNNGIMQSGLTLTCNYADVSYPVSNLQDYVLAKKFKSSNDTFYIKTSGKSITASYLILLNCSFPSGTEISLQGNNTDTWGSPAFTEAVTVSNGTLVHALAQEHTYLYWRLVVTSTLFPVNSEIGGLFLGTYFDMPGMKRDQEFPLKTNSEKQISTSGAVYSDRRYRYRTFRASFPAITRTQATNIKTWWEYCENIIPFTMLLYGVNNDLNSTLYVVVDQDDIPLKRQDSDMYPWTFSCQFREVF